LLSLSYLTIPSSPNLGGLGMVPRSVGRGSEGGIIRENSGICFIN